VCDEEASFSRGRQAWGAGLSSRKPVVDRIAGVPRAPKSWQLASVESIPAPHKIISQTLIACSPARRVQHSITLPHSTQWSLRSIHHFHFFLLTRSVISGTSRLELSDVVLIDILMSIFERRPTCTIRLVGAWAKWGKKCVGLLPQLCWFRVGLGGSYLPEVNGAGSSSGRAERAFQVSNCLHAGLTSTV
jgi:hypothetical protein